MDNPLLNRFSNLADETTFIINLIDSPGHVDFYGEVSAAVRLCDGCLIVVDVVEGICPQTITALKQAWIEGLKPILILNKMDRLFFEKEMEQSEAYDHLRQILEQINVVQGDLFTSGVLKQDYENVEDMETKSRNKGTESVNDGEIQENVDCYQEQGFTFDWTSPLDAVDDSVHYFTPESNNVIFCSATDSWAFTIESFASMYSTKSKISKSVLNRTLWGDYYMDTKKKRIFKGAVGKGKEPLFVQKILNPLWKLFEPIKLLDPEKRKLTKEEKVDQENQLSKMVQSLGINVSERQLKHPEPRMKLRSIMSQWLPLPDVVFPSVCKLIPSPLQLTSERVEHLMCSRLRKMESLPEESRKLKQDFLNCSTDETSTKIVCVSKMVPMDLSLIRQVSKPVKRNFNDDSIKKTGDEPISEQKIDELVINEPKISEEEPNKQVFIAFARIFSGRIKVGDKLYVLGPKYDPNHRPDFVDPDSRLVDLAKDSHVTLATISGIHILMGRDLINIKEAVAGNVIGLTGLEGHVLKSATLSDSLFCPPFVDLHISAPPILKVAIEPEDLTQMPQLIKGLKLLNQSDPNVKVQVEETGEHVIVSPGEVHLQKCIDDLESSFAGIKLKVSEPIVPYRETIINPPKFDMVNESVVQSTKTKKDHNSEVIFFTANKKCSISLKSLPIPDIVSNYILEHIPLLKIISTDRKVSKVEDIDKFKEGLKNKFDEAAKELSDQSRGSKSDCHWWTNCTIDQIISFGPKNVGANMLLDQSGSKGVILKSFWEREQLGHQKVTIRNELESSIINGFQLATLSGPLCEEPMMGVAFVVTSLTIPGTQVSVGGSDNQSTNSGGQQSNGGGEEEEGNQSYGPLAGQLMSTVREGCRRVFLSADRRLKMAMFTCMVQVSQEAYGKLNNILI